MDFFVSFNAGEIERDGLVVIIGTPRQDPPKAVQLVDGNIPKGMEVKPDGTVRGIPEESGHFEFTLEFTEEDSHSAQQSFAVELTD